MEKIAIISDCVHPTPYEYGHGLGRSAYNLAKGLSECGWSVTLFGAHGSALSGSRVVTVPQVNDGRHEDKLRDAVLSIINTFDYAIDMSHTHFMGKLQLVPTITDFQDRASGPGKNCVFVSEYVKNYVNLPGEVIYNGIDTDEYTLYEGTRDDYLLFIGSDIGHKGLRTARRVAKRFGFPLKEYGNGCRDGLVSGRQKIELYRRSYAVLCPYEIDAGPHVPLEAMACGTPVVALDKAAMPEYVPVDGGYICSDEDEMVGALRFVDLLVPRQIRNAVVPFDIRFRITKYQELLNLMKHGRRW